MKKTRTRFFMQFTVIFFITCATGFTAAEQDPLKECRSASNSELGDVRGGYLAGNGMELSFGIEKMLAVNGVLLSNDTLSFMLGEAADLVGPAVSGSMANKVVQNGAGNSLSPALLEGLGTGTFIQNSMDRALIQNTTTMDVSITVRDLYRDLNLSSTVNQQLIHSLH